MGLRSDGWTDLGECKWGSPDSWSRVAVELDDKVQKYPNARNATIGRHLFVRSHSKSRHCSKLTGVTTHSLEELYEGWG